MVFHYRSSIISRTNWYLKHTHTHTKESTPRQTQWKKKCITFTSHSPLIHRGTNLFKGTDLNIAFWTCNIIDNQLYDWTPISTMNSSEIYTAQYKTCNNSYADHTGRMIEIGHLENTSYITTNNPILALALHISERQIWVWKSRTNQRVTKAMQHRKENALLGIILHTSSPTTKLINRWTED